jgi:hypothetical protein
MAIFDLIEIQHVFFSFLVYVKHFTYIIYISKQHYHTYKKKYHQDVQKLV